MWKILKMIRRFFKSLIVHWKTFAIFVIPTLLSPVAFIDGTPTFRCAYVALVMALFWYLSNLLSRLHSVISYHVLSICPSSYFLLSNSLAFHVCWESYKKWNNLCSGCSSFYLCRWRLWFPSQSSLFSGSCQPTKWLNAIWKTRACSTLEVTFIFTHFLLTIIRSDL